MKKVKQFIYLLGLLLIILLGSPGPLFFSSNLSMNTYNNWMKDTMPLDRRITEMAMLGAHDAFAHPLTLFSSCDTSGALLGETASSLACNPFGFIYKGLLIRYSQTQYYDVTTLLEQGIRYFDVRLSYDASTSQWFHNHTFLSLTLQETMGPISRFMNDHPGEVLILDFQHIYDERTQTGRGDENSYNEIKAILSNCGIYAQSYSFTNEDISSITYGDITQNRTKGSIIMTFPIDVSDTHFLFRDTYVRSTWHNHIRNDLLLEAIENEHAYLLSFPLLSNQFRVMQAQVTASLSPSDLSDTLLAWSLLDATTNTHSLLLKEGSIDGWLVTTPILMVDFAGNNLNLNHDQFMNHIIAHNLK